MISENTIEHAEHVVSRWALSLTVFAWTAGAACVAFTTCYAYHLGI